MHYQKHQHYRKNSPALDPTDMTLLEEMEDDPVTQAPDTVLQEAQGHMEHALDEACLGGSKSDETGATTTAQKLNEFLDSLDAADYSSDELSNITSASSGKGAKLSWRNRSKYTKTSDLKLRPGVYPLGTKPEKKRGGM